MQKSFLFSGCGARLCARGRFSFSVKWLCAPRGPERRAGFFFELVLAPVARGWFLLLVKWLALRAGALVARGMFYLTVKWLALRAGQR